MKKLTMIGNAHLDPVWLWNWQEGFQEVKATFKSALDRMEEYDDFVFTCSASQYYEWIEENDLEMFEKIQQRVKEGRWEIVGGWIIQPDCNLPSGESFVRQGLYGQHYFQEKFGLKASVGYNVDSFGHNGSLPQILKKSGMDNYVFMRPMPNEMGISKRIFNWKSKDGSSVKCYRIPYEYCTPPRDLETNTKRLIEELKTDDHLMMFYGVGNHGGGPTKQNIESIYEMDKDVQFPNMKMGRVDEFFNEQNHVELDVVTDLQHHASGCYAANSAVKQYNRLAENMLVRAEKYSILANHLLGKKYPLNYKQAWKNVLFNQFHDILAGCSIKSAYRDASYLYGESLAIAQRNENSAIQSISWKIDIPEELEMVPVVVFNPNGFKDNVIVEFEARGYNPNKFQVLDYEGNIIPTQAIKSEATVDINSQSRILLQVEVEGLGYKTLKLYKNRVKEVEEKNVKVSSCTLENEFVKYTFDKKSGMLTNVYDKNEQLNILRRDAKLSIFRDPSDTWSHNIFKFDDYIADMECIEMKVVEMGTVRSTIQVTYKYKDSYICQRFSLYATESNLQVDVNCDWREPSTIVKLIFPVNLNFRSSTYEIPYGYIEKSANGEEEAAQTWIDVSGEHFSNKGMYGLSIINNAKSSYHIDTDEMAMTIIKNSVFAHHDPRKLSEVEDYDYVDHGQHTFKYIVNPHKNTWRGSNTVRLSQRLNQPATSVIETFHKGTLPIEQGNVNISQSNVLLGGLKKAENENLYILRLYESEGISTEVDVELFGMKFQTRFKPTEIKSFALDINRNTIIEVDFLEEQYENE